MPEIGAADGSGFRRALRPQGHLKVKVYRRLAALPLVPGDRRQEIARVGEPVGADRPQIGQAEQGAEVLADIAASLAVRQLDPEAHAARDHDDFLRLGLDQAELGREADPAALRHDRRFSPSAL